MSQQQQKQPFWYRFLHRSDNANTLPSVHENLGSLTKIKIITENDLKIESLLMEEFRFRGDFLKQILSDTTSTFNLYFLFLGISISGISIIYQLGNKTLTYQQLMVIMSSIIFGIGNTLFFIRFISLVHNYQRHKAVLNDIREYYIKHLQNQIPDIGNVFRTSLRYSFGMIYASIVFLVFAVLDSLCFAVAAFVLTELRLHFNALSPFPNFSDSLSYIIALLTGVLLLLFHALFYRFTLSRDREK